MRGFDLTQVLLPLAHAHLELGDVAAAQEAVAEALTRARSASFRFHLVDALHVQAMVATRQHHWSEAEQALEEGLTLAQRMPYPYAEGRLLHVYGEIHFQKGEPHLTRARLEAALAIFRRLGPRKDAERVERALAMDVEGSVF
jgi:Tfp pilus assembly protein PilF